MKILAFEFSSSRRSVAALRTDKSGVSTVLEEIEDNSTRNTHAFRLVEAVLRKAGMEREEIECLAVGIGPGSYNGVRLAIALAQGWQLALGTRILGVSAMECLATQAQVLGQRGKVNVVVDAQQGEFYLASYDASDAGTLVREPVRLAKKLDIQAKITAAELVFGPEADKWFTEARAAFPSAATLAALADGRTDFVDGETLEPLYLRETAFVKAPTPRTIPSI